MSEQAHDQSMRIERRPSLAQVAAEKLRAAIIAGELRKGQHLREAEMAGSLGISRGPLREAFKLLAADGFLEFRQERGVFVSRYTDDEIQEMIITRAILEGAAARLFVLRAGAEHQRRLRELLEAMELASVSSVDAGGTRVWRELDWSFHETMLIGAGNEFLQRSWAAIGQLLRVYMMQMNPLYERERKRVLETHRRMLEVLLGKDPARAENLFRQTILTTGFQVLDRAVPEGLVDLGGADGSRSAAPESPPR